MTKEYKPTIAIDFDGVIHSYTSGWKGAHIIPDLPVPGAMAFLSYLADDGTPANAAIFSARARTWRGRRAIRAWLRKHAGGLWHESMGTQGIESIPVTAKKPIASVYLDDRAVRFEGMFPELRHEAIKAFAERKPWHKETAGAPTKEEVEARLRHNLDPTTRHGKVKTE